VGVTRTHRVARSLILFTLMHMFMFACVQVNGMSLGWCYTVVVQMRICVCGALLWVLCDVCVSVRPSRMHSDGVLVWCIDRCGAWVHR